MYRLRKTVTLIVACKKRDWGIGYGKTIPWKCPEDLRHFKRVTTAAAPDKKNVVIMGRKTFESIGRPLPNRINYIVSRTLQRDNTFTSLDTALIDATDRKDVDKVFVIGGADIYEQVLQNWYPYIFKTYITEISTDNNCDRFLDRNLVEEHHEVEREMKQTTGVMTFYQLRGKHLGENAYLHLMRKILDEGELRDNRTDMQTISIFGERMEFDISETIPFITTKKLAWKTMLRELLWFISGDTNNATLQNKRVHIWDGNSTREYLDSIGLYDRKEGHLGPVYGHQWRHFGADYVDADTDYTGQGVDQLALVIDQLRNKKNSRRIILTAWNPAAQPLMCLPACHLLSQWYVRGEYLDCQMYQRSADVALGVPFNIASYSILTYMLGHLTGLKPGKFIHVIGDAHLYVNHIDGVKEQLERHPYMPPTLRFKRKVESIDDFVEDDFIIENYNYHPTIKMKMTA